MEIIRRYIIGFGMHLKKEFLGRKNDAIDIEQGHPVFGISGYFF
jgi:hypothetical protein